MKRISLGDEDDPNAQKLAKIIREKFPANHFKLYRDGFIYNDIYVEFLDEKSETLFRLLYGNFVGQ